MIIAVQEATTSDIATLQVTTVVNSHIFRFYTGRQARMSLAGEM